MKMRGASFFTYGREPGRIGRGPALAAFVAVLLLAAGLRLYTVFSESLSGDEIFQRNIAAQPYFQQPSLIRGDIHPPLYYWLTKASASVFGYGVFGLRLPALVFGWLTALLTMILALRLFRDVRLALAAGLLVSLSDIQIVFSHFARSYAFLSALVLAYILVLELALRRSDRRSPWLILSGLSILMAYTHYFAWLFIAAIAPAVLLRKDRRALWRWVLTAAVAALCLLPWILYSRPAVKTAGGIQTVLAWVPTPTLRSLAELFARYTGAAGSVTSIALSCAAGFFFCAVAFLGRRRSPANPNLCSPLPAPVPSFLWLTVLAPPLFLFLLSLPPLNYPVWGIRHLLPGQAVWAILLASGAAGFFPRRRGAFAAAMIILACLQAVPMVDSLRSYWFEPYHRVARVIKSETRTREFPPLFLFSESAGSIMRFYLEGELNLRLIPAGDEGFPLEWMAVYRPAEASEAGRIMRFLDKGYSVVWSRDFIKRPGDPRGLRLVFLRK